MKRGPAPRLFALALLAACSPAGELSGVLATDPPVGEVPDVDVPRELPPFQPGRPVVRRLLYAEYVATVRALLGDAAAASASPPLDTAINGLDAIGAGELIISDASVRAYESSARAIAENSGPAARARYGRCTPSSTDDAACVSEFVSRFGRMAFRRTLTAAETAAFVALGRDAAVAYQDFDRGIELVLAAMLQSPSFLYRIEQGRLESSRPGARKLTDLELAARMSFFLTGATPDESLLDAAENGGLTSEEKIVRHARRLLEARSAPDALATFYDEVLRLRELPELAKNQEAFPAFDDQLKRSMREETLALIRDVVWDRNADFGEIFDAPYTFVDDRLARHYGLAEPGQPGFHRVTLPLKTKRGGILGHASFLSLQSHVVNSSPTLRGKFVREALLCQPIPAPPPGVDTNLPADPPDAPPKTMRDRLAEHTTNAACAGCHSAMDGIGLGLENFDPIGAYRETENGVAIDAVSDFEGQRFEGARELGSLLRAHDRSMACTVRMLYRQAVGRVEDKGEKRTLDALDGRFAKAGHRLKELLVEIVVSEGFRYVSEEGP